MENQEVAVDVKANELTYSRPAAYAEDLRIAQAIAAGDRALFKNVYDRNINTLFNLARRLAGTALRGLLLRLDGRLGYGRRLKPGQWWP